MASILNNAYADGDGSWEGAKAKSSNVLNPKFLLKKYYVGQEYPKKY